MSVSLEDLIDSGGTQFAKRNLKFILHDVETELLEDPLWFKTPIVRNGNVSTIGYVPDIWNEWLKSDAV